MAAREAGDAARADLAAIGDEAPHRVEVLVVDVLDVDARVLARPVAVRERPRRRLPGAVGAGLALLALAIRRRVMIAGSGPAHERGAGRRSIRVSRRLEGDVVLGRSDRRRPRRSGSPRCRPGTSDCGAWKPSPPSDRPVVVARAQELDRSAMISTAWRLLTVLGLPLAPVEPAVDRDRTALGEVVGAVLALRAPDRDVEVVGLVDPLAAVVLAAAVDGDAKLADGGPAGGAPQLGVAGSGCP